LCFTSSSPFFSSGARAARIQVSQLLIQLFNIYEMMIHD
jgi:hypothetical protein